MVPNLVAGIGNGCCCRASSERGRESEGIIVYEIETSKSVQRPREHHVDIGRARDICYDSDCFAARALYLIHNFLCISAVQVDHRHAAAALSKTERSCSADPRARASYQAKFTVKAHY